MRAAFDLLDADAIEDAGLRADAGMVAFAWQGSRWLVVPLRDDAGAVRLRDLVAARGRPRARDRDALLRDPERTSRLAKQ